MNITVTEDERGRYRQTVTGGNHQLTADEPLSAGGDDAGFSPFDLLLAALGTCTAMTLRMYAERKALPLEKIVVHLHHERQTLEGVPRNIIQREISLEGPLDAKTRERLLEIANRCPLHRALTEPVVIDTTLAPAFPGP